MKWLFDFVNRNGYLIILILLLISLQNACFVGRKFKRVSKDLEQMVVTRDSLVYNIYKEMETVIQIEGLKAELRMIEATDRKLWDMERQTKIREEIKQLEEKTRK